MKTKIIYIGWILSIILGTNNCSAQDKSSGIGKSDRKIYQESISDYSDSIQQKIDESRRNAITRAVEKVMPAVVGINVFHYVEVPYYDPFFEDILRQFFGMQREELYRKYKIRGLGSGFIVSPDGYILTNHHVAGNASKIVVTTTGGKQYDAKLVLSDKLTDIALLKIEGDNFPYLKLGNSDNVIVGEWVIALGNPFGLFDLNMKPTVTVGVVSNKNVNLTQNGRMYKGMIQTDAAISSGNSGGPLVNSLGEVIGINTMIYSTATSYAGAGSIGIGWAIPINRVKKIVDRFFAIGEVQRILDYGFEVIEPNSDEARAWRLNFDEGLMIVQVKRNSIASNNGLEPGDIILEVNGEKVNTERDLYYILFDTFRGDELVFKVKRGNEILNLRIVVTESPKKSKPN
ncbi:MAG: trypsin-like peptidase domain-containing protein [Ignavibacteria bacterium]|nr:trypsin-like peptidase domain-containing protein [Ignavibacteria bacterium]